MSEEQTLEEALKLLDLGNHEAAFGALMPLARQGIVRAQENIGVMYQLGLGVDRNVAAALGWLKQAAEAGSGVAAHNLGTLYQTCEPERPIDSTQSKYWFNRARELGFNPSTQ